MMERNTEIITPKTIMWGQESCGLQICEENKEDEFREEYTQETDQLLRVDMHSLAKAVHQ